jgi:hypothetical protein
LVAKVAEEQGVETPLVTGVSPTIGAAGTGVTVEGSGFAVIATDNVVTLNGVPVALDEATSTRLTVRVSTNATSGPLKVVTAGGAAAGPDFTVPPSGYTPESIESTQRIVAGGDLATVTVDTAGKAALFLFDGLVAQRVSLHLTSGTIGTSSCCAYLE